VLIKTNARDVVIGDLGRGVMNSHEVGFVQTVKLL